MKAAEFSATKKRRAKSDLTIGEALDGYIRAKEGVLSPATIRGYVRMRKHNYKSIENRRIRSFSQENLQLFVSECSRAYSPKSTKNIYSLLKASLSFYCPGMHFKATLPAKAVKRPASPSEADIRALHDAASDRMKVCIDFAACGFRPCEISAIKYEDIKDGIAHVHADMVKDKDGKWIYKPMPKTSGSDRFVRLPASLLERIGSGTGFVVKINPASISKRFEELRDSLGINIRLYDLRHFFASIGAVIQIPDIYMADLGGWQRGGSVMKSVYQNNISSMSDYYSVKMADHLDGILGDGSGTDAT